MSRLIKPFCIVLVCLFASATLCFGNEDTPRPLTWPAPKLTGGCHEEPCSWPLNELEAKLSDGQYGAEYTVHDDKVFFNIVKRQGDQAIVVEKHSTSFDSSLLTEELNESRANPGYEFEPAGPGPFFWIYKEIDAISHERCTEEFHTQKNFHQILYRFGHVLKIEDHGDPAKEQIYELVYASGPWWPEALSPDGVITFLRTKLLPGESIDAARKRLKNMAEETYTVKFIIDDKMDWWFHEENGTVSRLMAEL